jgi:hypothetical protein
MLSLTSLTVLALTGQAAAWGGLGHRTVGYLAQHFFTEDASQLIQDLLKPTESFDIGDAAVWPDTIRMRQPFTEGWHFIGETSGVGVATLLVCTADVMKWQTRKTTRQRAVIWTSNVTVSRSRAV